MLKDTLNEILKAEQEADEIMAKAEEDAKQAVLSAELECDRIRKTTVKAVKEERKKVVESATKEGDVQYAKILSIGNQTAEKMAKETDVAVAVKFIKEKVLSGYVNS